MEVVISKHIRLLIFMFGLFLTLGLHQAQAARGYFDGTPEAVGTVCAVTGNAVITTQNTVGYFTDPNEPFPKTGDVAYVRASSTNISPCTNDAVGFEFFPPDGATLAISAANPVRCYVVRLSDNTTIEFTNNPQNFQGACSQTPVLGTVAGGYSFGYAVLPSGWQIQIHVPLQFNKQLLGIGGPNTHRVTAVAVTAFGNAFPVQPVTVFYEADFLGSQSTAVTSTSATLNINLYSYFKAGQLYLDYGTTNALGSSLPPTNVPDTSLNFPNVSSSLTGLTPGTTYHWRYRFVTTAGTFTSSTQTFTTSGSSSFALSVSKSGTGSGTVSSSPAGIDCGATCSATFAQGTSVTLTPTPASGSTFARWGGACSGTGGCTVTMDAAKSVSATFDTTPVNTFSLTVSKTGTGSGTVSSSPAGIDCGATCSTTFSQNASVTLTATPASGSTFTGWSGACSGTGSCTVTMDAAKTVTAAFNTTPANTFALTVTKSGSGSSTVTSSPSGINCGATCTASFNDGTTVTLSAVAAGGSSFTGWSGACTGTGSCTLTMNAARAVSATFSAANTLGILSLEVTGLPSGKSATLTMTGPGGFSATRTIATGTGQTLNDVSTGSYTITAPNVTVGTTTYVPNNASQTVTVTSNATVTVRVVYAEATVPTFALTVTKAGTGGGAVSSTPAGLNCGSTCTASFTENTSVTLSATAAAGSSFAAWNGACTGTGTCTVTMNAAKAVTATFDTNQAGTFALTVNTTGGGTVTSSPAGIACGADCTANFASGATVTLTAIPDTGFTFAGWGGACSGTAGCTVTMTGAQNVNATFQASSTAPAPVSASKTLELPANTDAKAGDSNVSMLSFGLSGEARLSAVTLTATGTGNDALDLSAVKLVLDANANGKADTDEIVLAQGTFAADNAETTLTLASPQTLSSSAPLLVTVDINTKLAVLSAFSLVGLGALSFIKRKRVRALLLLFLVPLLMAQKCGDQPPVPRTYQVVLKNMTATATSGTNLEVTGLPLEGTTLTVKP